MIEVENTDVNIVRNLIPMRNHMPASAYGLKAISDWLELPISTSCALCNVCIELKTRSLDHKTGSINLLEIHF